MLLGHRLLQMLIPPSLPQPKHKTIIHPPHPLNSSLNIIPPQTQPPTIQYIIRMDERIVNILLVLPTCYYALYTYFLSYASKSTI